MLTREVKMGWSQKTIVMLILAFLLASCGGAGNDPGNNNNNTDTSPPDTSISSGPDDPTGLTDATFIFASTENGSSFECSIDGANYTACTSPENDTGLSEGSHIFAVRAIDAAGNVDPTPATYAWTIDVTPPDTSVSSGPANPTTSTDATFTFASTEAGSRFECRIDGGVYAACASPENYTGLSVGSHTFEVRSIDAVGNTDPTPASIAWVVTATQEIGNPFPVEVTPTPEFSASAAYDGIHWLVGIFNKDLNGVAGSYFSARLVDSGGSLVGSRIDLSSNAINSSDLFSPVVAFDGTNYLVVWSDNSNAPNNDIYGQFIDTSGNKVGSSFAISQAAGQQRLGGVVFDGTNYFVVWGDYDRLAQYDRYIYGQFVSPSGTLVGSEIKISTNKARFPAVAFTGSDLLVAWIADSNDTDVVARYVAADGTLGSEFTVNANSTLSDNSPSLACDTSSGNCLVVWMEEYDVTNKRWDVFHQLLSPTGTPIGLSPDLTAASGNKNFASVAFDGNNFLVTWTDFSNDANVDLVCDAAEASCLDVYGQYIDTTGSPSGAEFAINTEPRNQLGFLAGYGGGKYLVLIDDGITMGSQGFTNDDVYGQYLSPSTPQQTGVLFDAPVAGVNYQTATQSGVTDAQGQYAYLPGEKVSFSIGDIVFPATDAGPVVTPLDMIGVTDLTNTSVINILRLLQSLDIDGDPTNGITIDPAAHTAASGLSIAFDSATFATDVASLVANSGSVNTSLIDGATAVSAFKQSLSTQTIDWARYLNLADRRQWNYLVTQGGVQTGTVYEYTVNGTANGQDVYIHGWTPSWSTYLEYYLRDLSNGLLTIGFQEGGGDIFFATPTMIGCSNLYVPCTVAGSLNGMNYSFTFENELDKITVPAGTYNDCIKTTQTDNIGTENRIAWYCRDTGAVKNVKVGEFFYELESITKHAPTAPPYWVTGTITLPASVTNQEWFVGIDTDLDGNNGLVAFQQGTVTGNSFSYSIHLPVSGNFYVFAEVNVAGTQLGPWETGDYVGEACGDRLTATECTVTISADSVIDFSLSVMP